MVPAAEKTSPRRWHPTFLNIYGKKMRVKKRKAIVAEVTVADSC